MEVSGIISSGFALLMALWPVVAVGSTEIVNFIKKKVSDSSLPGPVRWAVAFIVGAVLKAIPEGGQVNPDEVGQALIAFVAAILAAIKLRDEVKKRLTGDPVE